MVLRDGTQNKIPDIKNNHCTITSAWMMWAGCNWSVVAEYLPPLLLTLRRWQHWWWEAPCPGSCWAEPVVHPGSQQRNHKLIYLPCLYCCLYLRLLSAKSECSPGSLVVSSHSPKRNSWVSNCSAWLTSLFVWAEVSCHEGQLFDTSIPGKSCWHSV